MGIVSSRRRRNSHSTPGHHAGEKHRKRGYFRLVQPTTTSLPLVPHVSQPLYTFNYPFGIVPAFGRVRPMPSPYSPIAYNNYPISSPYMMMRPQQIVPSPYASPMPAQPMYNTPAFGNSVPVGNPYYPLAQPARLLTDWTAGGKISPGFLGPPL